MSKSSRNRSRACAAAAADRGPAAGTADGRPDAGAGGQAPSLALAGPRRGDRSGGRRGGRHRARGPRRWQPGRYRRHWREPGRPAPGVAEHPGQARRGPGARPGGSRGRADTRRPAAGGPSAGRHRDNRHRPAGRRHRLPDQRADAVPHSRAPDHLHQRVAPPGPGRDRDSRRQGTEHPAGPVHRQRKLLLLAAHPRRRRHHPHRVAGAPRLYPGRVLRRVGPAARARSGSARSPGG